MRGTITLVAIVLLLAGLVAHEDTDSWTVAERMADAVRAWDDRDPTLAVERAGSVPEVRVTAGTATLRDVAAAFARAGFARSLAAHGGTWTLTGMIVIGDGATLSIRDTRVRMAGTAGLHASGGRLALRRVAVTGWDSTRRAPDTALHDGRAWVLASDGGVITADDTRLSHLGNDARHRWGVTVAGERSRARITESSLTANYDGLHVTGAGFAHVESTRVRGALRHGVVDTGGRRLIVDGANIVGSAAHGVLVEGGSHTRISNSAIHVNRGAGVVVRRAGPGVEITGNNIYRNPSAGIVVLDVRDMTMRGNLIHTSDVGIAVRGASSTVTIDDNRVASNRTDGVWISEASRNVTVTSNRIDFNNEAAIAVKTGTARVTGNLLTQNFDGVRLETPPYLTVRGEISENTITGNVQDGVDLPASASLPVVGNLIAGNREGGLSVVAGGDAEPAIARNDVRDNGRGAERVRETDVAEAGGRR